MARRIAALLVGLAAAGAALLALRRAFRDRVLLVTQPIAFSHRLHLTKARLDCTTICHSAAGREVYAGLPSKDVCFECHNPDEDDPNKPELTRLASYSDGDRDIPWRRVAVTRADVFFSHRRHVTAAQIACARCHPGVAESSRPLTVVSLVLRMDDCLDCHREHAADTDCLACHR